MYKTNGIRQRLYLFGIAALTAVSAPANAQTFPTYACGNIDMLTSIGGGLFIRLAGSIIPTNCSNHPGGGLYYIPQTSSAMTSVIISRWLAGKTSFCLYTDATSGQYCSVNQAQPGG